MITTSWDPIIEEHAGAVPLTFIRALMHGESRGDPQIENSESKAAGLLQITEVVRRDWNAAHPSAPVAHADLFKPEINLRLGSALLNRIVATYGRHPTLQPDWTSRRFAELVALGWNAGYSDKAGVGYVVGRLEAAGAKPEDVTADAVARVAPSMPKATRYLAEPGRLTFAKAVADVHLGSRRAPVVASKGGDGTGAFVAVALGALGLAFFGSRKRRTA